MPTVTVEISGYVLRLEATADDNLCTKVEQAVTKASQQVGTALKPRLVLFTGSNDPVSDWQTQLVGTQAITVVTAEEAEETSSGGTMMSILQSLLCQSSASVGRIALLEEREAEAWAPRLRNVVSQMLLHACSQNSFRTTTTDYWSKELGQTHDGVQGLALSMGVAPEQLLANADAVITRRNKCAHPSSLADLDEEVAAVRGCITDALRRKCKWECNFLEAYDKLKEAFPERFR